MNNSIQLKSVSIAKKNTVTLFAILVVFLLIGCNHNKVLVRNHKHEQQLDKHDTETHHKKEGLYTLPGLKHGLLQSPINILSHESPKGGHNVTFNFKDRINKIQNLGHTIQLDFEPGSTVNVNDKTYEFKQIHFHTPAEHLIDGITYPMEMHVVNTLAGQTEDDTTEYLVFSFLFRMGKENKFIEEFIHIIPGDKEKREDVSTGTVNLKHLLTYNPAYNPDEVLKSYFFYKGSLTTPPYTESVKWFVMKTIIDASPEQIQQINKIEGDNARRIQALYGRSVSD
ncbi:MAG: carbonic anhydrase family protein [Candidatus Brocadiaceae bacterium]|nr:carbonic anhydrase family protein [Candidatus Brocadiaceae bacterium]